MSADMFSDLLAQAATWDEQANAMLTAPPPKKVEYVSDFEERLSMALASSIANKRDIDFLIGKWDRSGDGRIAKGEFRLSLRSIDGLDDVTTEEIDQLCAISIFERETDCARALPPATALLPLPCSVSC